MNARALLRGWLGLLVLLALQFAGSWLPLGRALRPLLLVPTALMLVLVGLIFMQVNTGPRVIRLFVVMALLWLLILLLLGSLDPLTRIDHYIAGPRPI